jgi:hypothetical protein
MMGHGLHGRHGGRWIGKKLTAKNKTRVCTDWMTDDVSRSFARTPETLGGVMSGVSSIGWRQKFWKSRTESGGKRSKDLLKSGTANEMRRSSKRLETSAVFILL